MLKSVETIFLIRHASPDLDRHDLVYHLPPGPPLTAAGLQEANALAEFLSGMNIDRLYSSPLERCLQTAGIIAEKLGLQIQIEPGLAEIHPKESESALKNRVWPVWEAITDGSDMNNAAAVVTHGAPISLLLKELKLDETLLTVARQQFDHSNPLPPAGVWKAERLVGEHTWQLELAFIPEKYDFKL